MSGEYPSLKNKNVIVTGATSGIGFATTISFAKYGANVVATGRNEIMGDKLMTKINELGSKGKFIKADIRFREDMDMLIQESLEFLDNIDILVNNAGIEMYKNIIEASLDELENLYKVNLYAPFYLMKK